MPLPWSSAIRRSGLPDKTVARAFLDRYLHYWLKLDGNLPRNDADFARLFKERDAEVNLELKNENVSDLVAAIFLPGFGNISAEPLRAGAERQTTGALLSALELRAKIGRMLDKASEIPGSWKDPYNNQPLRIKVKGDSIRVYSVGPDLKDHGGIDASEASVRNKADIVAAYPPIRKKT
jgi:hypothetical protein